MRKSNKRRNQQILMTHVDLNSAAPIGSPVWIINELVDKLDTSEIEDSKGKACHTT